MNFGSGYEPSLALDSSNKPFIAWHEDNEVFTGVFVKRWDGSTWIEVRGLIGGVVANNAKNPSLKIGSDGNPVVASEVAGNIYIKRFDGLEWVQIGKALNNSVTTIANHPILSLRSDGKPIVTWDEQDGGSSNIYVKRY